MRRAGGGGHLAVRGGSTYPLAWASKAIDLADWASTAASIAFEWTDGESARPRCSALGPGDYSQHR